MPTTARSPHAQTLRALVLAVVASGGATTAHALGGGHLVSGAGVAVATALLTGATLPFVRTRPSAGRSVVLLAALQVAAHVVHGLSALAAGRPVQGATGTGPSHAAHGIRPLGRIETGIAVADPSAHGALADLLPTPTMLLAHVVAAVAVGVLLTRGEQSWWVACALVTALAVGLTGLARSLTARHVALWQAIAAVRASLPVPRAQPSDRPVPADVWRARTPVRRGPPALLLT